MVIKMKFRFMSKRKAKRELIEKIRAGGRKLGENDYLQDGKRFVVSGKHFLIYEECN